MSHIVNLVYSLHLLDDEALFSLLALLAAIASGACKKAELSLLIPLLNNEYLFDTCYANRSVKNMNTPRSIHGFFSLSKFQSISLSIVNSLQFSKEKFWRKKCKKAYRMTFDILEAFSSVFNFQTMHPKRL